mgnify:CR=1 FL=1
MPIFEMLDFDQDCVQAVISAPTRELAYQLYDRCRKIAKHFNVRVKLVTGGMEKVTQMEKQPQIVIGTPGRMKDMFIKDNVLRLDTAKIVVIDEADMTLEFGFLEDIDEILSKMDKKVQMMVFSATIPESLQPFLKKYLYDPEFIEIKKEEAFQSDVKHILVPCKHKSYEQKILDVLPCIQPYVCLIFANTTLEAQSIAKTMRENGYDLVELHSGLESRARMQAIKMIQSQKKSYIVASRGIDLEGITHVISCGFPKDLKFYIHRAGRTGRASRDGQCIALYKESDAKSIQSLIKQGIEFEHQDVKNKQFVDLKPYVNKRPMKKDEFHEEVEKIVHKKKKVNSNRHIQQRKRSKVMFFWDQHKTITNYYELLSSEVCSQYKLSKMEYDILMFLYNNPHYNTAADIVRVRKSTKSHVSTSLKKLENKGLIERIQKEDNKKHIEIILTSDTELIVQEGIKVQKQFIHNVLSGLTEEEKQMSIKIFSKICNNAEKCLIKYKESADENHILCKKENTLADSGNCVADSRL